jgi:5-hydroxyisourate hydrolase
VITVSTHVLDLVQGRPASGVPIVLEREGPEPGDWVEVRRGATDGDGRLKDLVPDGVAGTFRITFDTAAWWATTGTRGFYPYVQVVFVAEHGHHHVPLLLGPYGYSTYRGS